MQTHVIFGIEARICVLQSVMQAVNLGYECVVVGDCISSRSGKSYEMALNFFHSLSATETLSVLPSESIVFALLKDSKHANFKEISALIK